MQRFLGYTQRVTGPPSGYIPIDCRTGRCLYTMLILLSLVHVYTLTVSSHSLACQSSAIGRRPSRRCFPLSELPRIRWSTLAYLAVNRSPPNSTRWKRSMLMSMVSSDCGNLNLLVDDSEGTYWWLWFRIDIMSSSLILLFGRIPNGTYMFTAFINTRNINSTVAYSGHPCVWLPMCMFGCAETSAIQLDSLASNVWFGTNG